MQKYLKDFPLLDYDKKLMEIIREKQEAFQNRYDEDSYSKIMAKSDLFHVVNLNTLEMFDDSIWSIMEYIKTNPNIIIKQSEYDLWLDIREKYIKIYTTIINFNVLSEWIDQFFKSNTWNNFKVEIMNLTHYWEQFYNWIYVKDSDRLKFLLLLSDNLKNSIEIKLLKRELQGKNLKEIEKIIKNLEEKQDLFKNMEEIAISIENYKINNINEALRNVSNIFYNKDFDNISNQKPVTLKEIWNTICIHWFQILIFPFQKLFSSSKWWLFCGTFFLWLLGCFFFIEWNVFFNIIMSNDEIIAQKLTLLKDFSLLIISANIIISSFFGYVIVFCFGNYRKMEKINNEYRFRWIVTKSFWYLWQVANEEEKKILYPRMLDSIFKELPDDKNGNQESNISIPISEIVKNFWNSQK